MHPPRKRGTVQGFFYVKSRIPVANAIILSNKAKTYKDSLMMAAPHSNRTYKGISTGSRCFWGFFHKDVTRYKTQEQDQDSE